MKIKKNARNIVKVQVLLKNKKKCYLLKRNRFRFSTFTYTVIPVSEITVKKFSLKKEKTNTFFCQLGN